MIDKWLSGTDVQALLVTIIILLLSWYIRMQMNSRAVRRYRQISQAAEMLNLHGVALAEFLDNPSAPIGLKRVLIQTSDAFADKDAVLKIATWAASRAVVRPIDTEDARLIEADLTFLRGSRPDLADSFDTAIITALAGASLRWPESAALFHVVFPRMMATPKRDVTIAMTVTSFRPGVSLSVKEPEPAMA